MNVLTLSRIQFEEALHRLMAARQESSAIMFSLGHTRRDENVFEWLGYRMELISYQELQAIHQNDSAILIIAERPNDALLQLRQQFMCRISENRYCLLLAVGLQKAQGQVFGVIKTPKGYEPLHVLYLPGASMLRFKVQGLDLDTNNSACPLDEPVSPSFYEFERWSRTIGALGDGVWLKVVSLHYGIIGCGRTGSIVAKALSQIGVKRITLVDPDVVELHNLGEMEAVTESDIGRSKPEAIASSLDPRCEVTTISASVTTFKAISQLKSCDILICCVDNEAGRLATGIISSLYLKPLLDIGTGVFHSSHIISRPHQPAPRTIGADIRFIIPGDGCLLCLGGVANELLVQRALSSADEEQNIRVNSEWRQHRLGSLCSLNMFASSIGLRLIEDFIQGRFSESAWIQAEFDLGTPQLRALHKSWKDKCLCAYQGMGDDGLAQTPEILSELLSSKGEAKRKAR